MRERVVTLALVVVACVGLVCVGQDKDKADEIPSAKRGQLPKLYTKLGLTQQQKEKVYGVRAHYRDKVEALQKQIDKLREEERERCEKVLSKEQLHALRKLKSPDVK